MPMEFAALYRALSRDRVHDCVRYLGHTRSLLALSSRLFSRFPFVRGAELAAPPFPLPSVWRAICVGLGIRDSLPESLQPL
jgi:hypothetical protein